MKHNILLVGAGNLGRRYLEGMEKVKTPLIINVVDPSNISLDKAKDVGMKSKKNIHLFNYFNSIEEVQSAKIDLCIVSTTASSRSNIIKSIISRIDTKKWLLEKLIEQSSSKVTEIKDMIKDPSSAWVNTPRRIMDWHIKIKDRLKINNSNLKYLKVDIEGGNWGMACNSIHMIDLFYWWTGLKIESINVNNIEYWCNAKRNGFMEAYGSIKVNYLNGVNMNISCHDRNEPLIIKISTRFGVWSIYESIGKAIGPNGEIIEGKLTYQSELTAQVVENILVKGQCNLPNLYESSIIHIDLLNAMLRSWKAHQINNDTYIPIT